MERRPPLSSPPAPPPKVLVVGGGPFQLDIIRTAKELGAIVAVADKNASAPGLALADHRLVLDIIDVDAMIAAARSLGANGVVTAASDAALPAVAAIGEALGLCAVPVIAAARCRDKLATFECLRREGLDVPETVCAKRIDEAAEAVDRVGGYPLIVKPRSAAGGRGVAVVRDRAALAPAFARASQYDTSASGILVQRFVGGDALGVEAFFWRGSLHSAFVMDDQFVSGFVSPIGHSLPSALPASVVNEVCDSIRRFGTALDLREGPANFDLRYERGRTVLLEVNARLGGNSITDLVRATYGADLSAATVRAAMGQAPDDELRVSAPRPTAVRLILGPAREGTAHVDARALGDREGIDLMVNDGERPALRVDEHFILGRCVVRAETPVGAARRAREVAERAAAGIEIR
jgi:biotin carboxylase